MKLLKSALAYYDQGLNILPLPDNEKNPSKFLPTWTRYKTERMTREEIFTWFDNPRTTGIALICGSISGVIVVDDDDYKTGKKLDVHSNCEVLTATGGRHIYFKYNHEANANIKTDDHIFEIQGEGKLALLPPSVALNKKGELGTYTWLQQGDFTYLPALPDFSQYKKQNHSSEYLELDHGIQHNQMIKLINHWLFTSDERDWDTLVWNQIQTSASRYKPPYDQLLLQRDWEDCKAFVRNTKIKRSLPKTIQEIAIERVEERKLEAIAPSTGLKQLDYFIKGFVPGHLYTVSGLTNVGKTSVSANFAYNVYKQGKRVLYFSFEPGNTLLDYLASLIYQKEYQDLTPEDILGVSEVMNDLQIRTRDQVSTISDIVKTIHGEKRFDLIVIDHLGYFTKGESRAGIYQEQSNAVKQLVQIAKEYQSAIIQIVHFNKDGDSKQSLINIAGSKSITDDSTEVIVVSRDKDRINSTEQVTVYSDTGTITVHKTKCGPNGSVKINFKPKSAFITDQEVNKTWTPAF